MPRVSYNSIKCTYSDLKNKFEKYDLHVLRMYQYINSLLAVIFVFETF